MIQHEITREQYAALRERTNRRPAEQTNSAPVELVKILSEIGIIPTGNKKAAAAPDQENSDDL